MNKKEIIMAMAKEFGLVMDGEVMTIDTMHLQLTPKRMVQHFDNLATILEMEFKISFTRGETSGIKIASNLIGGKDGGNSTKEN